LETGAVEPQTGNVTVLHEDLYAGGLPTLTAEQAGAGSAPLFDARAPERYRGDHEPADAQAGHIPGAKNLPFAQLLTGDGTFLDDNALTREISDRGIEHDVPVGAYCGSGVSATVIVAALTAAGHEVALYPGSWSEWSSDPARAVARGDE
jgi:thiosulfate/3-mercaptopyruvate sulfurtransferase